MIVKNVIKLKGCSAIIINKNLCKNGGIIQKVNKVYHFYFTSDGCAHLFLTILRHEDHRLDPSGN